MLLRRAVRPVVRGGRLVLAGGLVLLAVALLPQSFGGQASYIIVSGDSMLPTLHGGDLAVLTREPDYQVGDVVAYRVGEEYAAGGHLVIHRVVAELDGQFAMQGDNVKERDLWQPAPEQVVGRLWFWLPGAGSIVAVLRQPPVIASLLAAFMVVAMLRPRAPRTPGYTPP